MKNIICSLCAVMVVFSCKDLRTKNDTYFINKYKAVQHPGKKLMETNCYVCHSPLASEEDRIGPPMVAIKKHYIDENTSKEEFIASMQAWIKNPNKEDAKMFGAVRRFGIMPKQQYPEETIAIISEYMYDFDIEKPDWFEDHYNTQKGMRNRQGNGMGFGNEKGLGMQNKSQTSLQELPYGERGLKYALATKAVLGKHLMGTIQQEGTIAALSFCKEQAYRLTDSMAVVQKTTIKRVSDKPRNPNNQANTEELSYISTFKKIVANGEEPQPIVNEGKELVQVYYPIVTNNMCLQCHGTPNKTIEKATFDKIKTLYPNDKATGYDINEVRGIWSITFAN